MLNPYVSGPCPISTQFKIFIRLLISSGAYSFSLHLSVTSAYVGWFFVPLPAFCSLPTYELIVRCFSDYQVFEWGLFWRVKPAMIWDCCSAACSRPCSLTSPCHEHQRFCSQAGSWFVQLKARSVFSWYFINRMKKVPDPSFSSDPFAGSCPCSSAASVCGQWVNGTWLG